MKSAQWIAGVLMVGALATAVVACNAITGIDDYEKVESLGVPEAGTDASPDIGNDVVPDVLPDGGPDVVDEDSGPEPDALDADVIPDVVVYDALEAGSVAHRLLWAQWKMPHAKVWDVPDAAGAAPPYEAGTIPTTHNFGEDEVTGLEWEIDAGIQPEPVSLGQAVARCKDIKTQAYRLPTRIELVSLLEPGLDPPIHPDLDGYWYDGPYWTQSVAFDPTWDPSKPREYWVVDFSRANAGVRKLSEEFSNKAYVRCVR